MSILEILLLGIGLSMDAFAVSICKGLSVQKLQLKHYLIIGAWFGGFQALMPTIGFFLGSTFEQYITAFDHWVAFVLLSAIGAGMIKESLSKEESNGHDSFSFKTMLLLALATSIDALAVGVSFAFLGVHIAPAVTLIGCAALTLACFDSEPLRRRHLQWVMLPLGLVISMSTVFVKQHSILDVFVAIPVCVILYFIIYHRAFVKKFGKAANRDA